MEDYQYFVQEFKKIAKIDLSKYKENQMHRRLKNFIRNNGLKDFAKLASKIKNDIELLKQVKNHITINVTEFKRNQHKWDELFQKIIPKLVSNKSKLRIWSAACSTGEEPYTIAILMSEYFPDLSFEIIATDIDDIVLQKAREGRYLLEQIEVLGKSVYERYFRNLGDTVFEVKPEIKRRIIFQKLDLLSGIYPSRIDLIVCRNVLIYFTEDSKEEIYHKFNRSLVDSGVLFVGSTEQIFIPEKYGFKLARSCFYQKDKESNLT